jgi:hypothetical protein
MRGDKQSETKYTFDIEYSDNVTNEKVDSVTFTYATGKAPETWTNVQEDKEYATDNDSNKAYNVDIVSYTDGDGNIVTLSQGDYPDYFKI